MRKVLNLSVIVIVVTSNFIIGQTNAEEKLSLMHNSLLLGLEEKGINLGVEIISLSEFISVKEKTLFILAEYFFSEGILGKLDEESQLYSGNIQYINKSYTFYIKLLNEYPNGEFKDIATQRINYLEQNYKTSLIFRSLAIYDENERLIIERKLNFANLFIVKKEENPFLFFTEGDEPNTYDLINRYFDDIIVNNPSQAIYAYYLKLLTVLSGNNNVDIITAIFEDESLPDKSYNKSHPDEEIVKNVTEILNILNDKNPHHPLTIQSYLIAVSYLIQADIWDYDSPEVKKWLELALINDNDKLGVKHLVTKEYMLKTEFDN